MNRIKPRGRFNRCAITLLAGWLAVSSGRAQTATPFEARCRELIENKANESDDARLNRLFEIDWDHTMTEFPEFATDIGYPGQNRRWTDQSLEAVERRKRELSAPLEVIKSIDPAKISAANQLNYALFKRRLEHAIEGNRFKDEYLAISQLSGPQQEVPQLFENMPHRTVADYEDMVARLRGVPTLVHQTMTLLRKGLETGVTPPRITLRDVPQQVKAQTEPDMKRNPIYHAFVEMPADISEAEQERLRREAAAIVKESVIPAFAELHEFLVKTYLPGAREGIAAIDLPDGKAWYAFNVRERTTTSLTPEQIHEIGLSEVKRIRGEMEAVIKETGFKGGTEKFMHFLRTDPRFFYTDADSLLTGYRDIVKRVDPELIKLFGKLPRLPYGVQAVPAYSEKSQTTAYYMPGSPRAGRPGYFCANTYDLKTRPKWEMEPLSLHESVPGHHLQIALAQELEGLPEFRKYGEYTAFVEGWGLYAESLGGEMGFYKDPYAKFGRLTYEMWRAIRLVVDTGMHTMGWSRQRAIDYFKANAGKMEHDIVVEIDRYIVWPGQALAYKIGELKIKELRAYAKKELGDKFDVREFHDHVLGNGAVPLDVLEAQIREWVGKKKNET